MNVVMSERGDVANLNEVITLYAQHHECGCPEDKVYGFRELVPGWKDLKVNYKHLNREVLLET